VTEQTQAAAPAAAVTPAAPEAPQVNEVNETAIWNELQEADDTASRADPDKAFDMPATDGAGEAQAAPAVVTPPAPDNTPVTPAAPAAGQSAAPAPTPEDKAAAEAAKLEHRIRSDQGRLEALQKRIAAATAKPSREIPAAREAIAGIKEDYPELAAPLDKLAEAVDGTRDDAKKAADASLEADTAELNAIIAENTATLVEKHPDYVDVLKSAGQRFADWVNDQPLRIRKAAALNAQYIADPAAAIEVVEAFKKHLGLTPAPAAPAAPVTPAPQPALDDRRARQLEGSATPQRSGGRPVISGIPEEGDPKAIWDAFDAQERQRA